MIYTHINIYLILHYLSLLKAHINLNMYLEKHCDHKFIYVKKIIINDLSYNYYVTLTI